MFGLLTMKILESYIKRICVVNNWLKKKINVGVSWRVNGMSKTSMKNRTLKAK